MKGESNPSAEAESFIPRLERLEWQPVLFAEQPRRWELMKLPASRSSTPFISASIAIMVLRVRPLL